MGAENVFSFSRFFTKLALFPPSLGATRVAAKEVARCLARVVASSKLLQEGMPKRASGADGAGKAAASADGGIGGGLAVVMKAFMRGLKTVAGVAEPDSCPLVASARGACRELGSEISTDVVKRAAALLLESFEALEGGAEVRSWERLGGGGGCSSC